jgi:integrase
MKYISKNVAKSVKLPKAKYTEKNFYTKDEIKKLLIAVKDTELETPVMLAVNYGLRRGEVLGLRWMDIDFENNKILIQNTRTKLGENIEKKPKSESSRRSLPLYPSFKQYLLQLKEKNNGKDLDYVCLNNLGKPMPTSVLNANFDKLLNKNNLRHIRFHDLRHTNASLLLSLGASLKEIQEWLGHAMFKTTADLYTHISVELKNLNADRLENFTQEIGVS